jgi:leucyl-tRNA synthetase
MRGRYEPAAIEPKWQNYWEKNGTFRAPGPGDPGFDSSKPKYYVLDMFPYPSGAGLHVGHPEGYTATDILARWRRMSGDNVLHPMGWDAFGLPAEQYAVATGTHPSLTTKKNIETFKAQIKALGFSYDWDREVSTADPDYYRWTQWIFRLLFETWYDEDQKRGRPISELPVSDELSEQQRREYIDNKRLAYIDEIAVWWCPALGTVLANEEVIDGHSERGTHPCVREPMRQWMLRITAYAERLLDDLETVDWPDETKKQQQEWIGRSVGALVWFGLPEGMLTEAQLKEARFRAHPSGQGAQFAIFTTRPDTLFGATYMVLAPEHPLVELVTTSEQQKTVEEYRKQTSGRSERDRSSAKEKTGVFTGGYAINPVNDQPLPIYIADYVLDSYGTGAIMAVPGHDERDFDFALAFDLPIISVYQKEGEPDREAETHDGRRVTCFAGEGTAIHSSFLDGKGVTEAKDAIIAWLEERGLGTARVNFRLRDWIFSRQRYWGEPFPVLLGPEGEVKSLDESELPLELPPLKDFHPTGRPEPLLAKAEDWVKLPDGWRRETNTMPNWAGSCWYYLRYLDPKNDVEAWAKEKEQYWMPVDLYVGGKEHAVLHLLYARFWHKVLYDRGYVSTVEPFKKLFHQGLITAFAYEDSETKHLVPSDLMEEYEAGKYRHKDTGRELRQTTAKMSKSLKNVVNPDDVIAEHGADALRLYEMFMGPLEASKPWNPRAVDGVTRFLRRSFRIYCDDDGALRANLKKGEGTGDDGVERALHQCIKKVTGDLEKMSFNTAIAAMMIFVNEATPKVDSLTHDQLTRYTKILGVFAPHLGEELWEILGHEGSIALTDWPGYDESLCRNAEIELPIQINGKVRIKLMVDAESTQEMLEQLAREAATEYLKDKTVRKVVVVPKRLVNFVVS